MKIVLYLMNIKGLQTLEALCKYFNPTIIKAVVASRDKNVHNDYYDDIYSFCKIYNINFIDRLEDNGEFDEDYRLAIGWRWIILSEEKLIVFHDSLLPKYRGFSPLVNTLINGDTEIGVTALFASDKCDQGDIIDQKRLLITYPTTIAEAISKVSSLYQDLAVDVVKAIQSQSLRRVQQNEIEATYSIWRDEEDYHIDWNESAESIVRFINAVGYPYLGAYSLIDDNKVRVLEAVVYDDLPLEIRHVGKVMYTEDGMPVVVTGKGLVKIKKLVDINGFDLLPLKQFRTRFK